MKQLFNYDNWQIDNKLCDSDTLQSFSNIEDVFLCTGEDIVKDKISQVIKFSHGRKAYYIKRYTGSGRKWFALFRKSRISREWENLNSLTKIGLPVPNIIAHGEKKIEGHFIQGALITEEVKNSANLAQWLKNNPELIKNKKWISTVIEQIAYFVRYMHENKFIHHDLNLRNILVQTKGYPAVYFIDCPAGGFNSGFSLERGIIRDLAHLDKVARYVLSERDLMRFYRKYKKIEKLSLKDKKFIAQIRHFHDKHRAKQNRKEGKEYRVL